MYPPPYMPYDYGSMNTRPHRYYFRGRHATSSATPRQIGSCLFCNRMGHLIKDCAKLKAAKQEQIVCIYVKIETTQMLCFQYEFVLLAT